MDRSDDERDSGIDALKDATGMEGGDDESPMASGRDVSDERAAEEAGGDERTAIEGAAGLAATQRGWGATPTGVEGGAGTNVPPEGDDELASAEEPRTKSSDPRGY